MVLQSLLLLLLLLRVRPLSHRSGFEILQFLQQVGVGVVSAFGVLHRGCGSITIVGYGHLTCVKKQANSS